jgi:DNA-binding transcriptional ArsR family regulator
MDGMLSFAALADPTRRRIVEMLAGRQLAAGEIAERFEVSSPAISQHLKILRQAHLVRVRPEAQRRIYELNPDGLDELESWVAQVRSFWSGRLDELERQLRKKKPNRERRKKR